MRTSETRNCVSIGFNSAKSSEPVRTNSLSSSALVMNSACTSLLINRAVARKRKNGYSVHPELTPMAGV